MNLAYFIGSWIFLFEYVARMMGSGSVARYMVGSSLVDIGAILFGLINWCAPQPQTLKKY